MFNTKKGFILITCLLLVGAFQSSIKAQDTTFFNPKNAEYLWPTNASHALSATFAETRSGHFHAALDIKTWGRRGYPVYATRAGTLHRMAIGPTGYGKVLYLQHDDGSYSVYAHLLRFNKNLQQLADSIRFSDYSSSFDIITDSLNIQFEQGEQIALSGASGIGPPHLHFELRTPDEEPFNPLLTNLKVKDTIAPTFSHLGVEPLSINTKIEGRNRMYSKRASRGTEYANFGTIDIQGPVGLSVDLFDQANNVSNVYAVYTLNMQVDGQRVFQSKVNQFSYDETDQMHLDRVYTLLEQSGRAYQRLYVADGNRLSFYQTSGNKGLLNLAPGKHDIIIEAADYFGNIRQAKLTLRVSSKKEKPQLLEQQVSKKNAKNINPDSWSWFNNWVNIPLDEFQQLTLAPLLISPITPAYFYNGQSVSVDLSHSPQFYFKTSATNYFIARRVHPQSPAYLTTPDKKAYASFPAHSFYDTSSVAIAKKVFSQDSVQIKLFPTNTPIRKSFNISVRMDSLQLADSTLSFYKVYPGGRYFRKLPTQQKGNYLTGLASSMGSYLILTDKIPPHIGNARIIKSADDKWLIYISARDRLSGIDYQRTEIYANGIRGITEYEPESGRLVYYHPDFKPASTNDVKIIAYDYIGNRTVKEATISF